MPRHYRLSAAEVAILTLFLIKEYYREKEKPGTRARVSQQTLRIIAARKRLRSAFIDEWTDELAALGWSAFPVGDNFAIIRSEATEGWPRIGSKRIRDTLLRVHRGEAGALAEVEEAIEEPTEQADDE